MTIKVFILTISKLIDRVIHRGKCKIRINTIHVKKCLQRFIYFTEGCYKSVYNS